MKTIENLEAELKNALQNGLAQNLPDGSDITVTLYENDRRKRRTASADTWDPFSAEIRITVKKGRKSKAQAEASTPVSEPASAQAYSAPVVRPREMREMHDEGESQLNFLKPSRPQASYSQPMKSPTPVKGQGGNMPVSGNLRDLIRSMVRAEARPGMAFIALKWFRDSFLPDDRLPWTEFDDMRQDALRQAIESGLLLTYKVPNPKLPQFPVTAIKLDRSRPEVQSIINEPLPVPRGFTPIELRGEGFARGFLRDKDS